MVRACCAPRSDPRSRPGSKTPAIVEVMLNPDGRLWIDRLSGGLTDTGERLAAADGERIVRLVAHHVGAEVHAGKSPRLGRVARDGRAVRGIAAARGHRSGLCHPQAGGRRIHARRLCRRRHHDSRLRPRRCATLSRDAQNILVAGGTSTGKTTLTNALLAEVAKTADRVVLIEDTRELQCKAPNLVALRTKDGVASLSDLVRSSLRLRPDRIPIGEVRGAEALDLLKAWGTGHPGGVGTIHAGTALGALRRLEQLIQEAVITVPRALIAETIDVDRGSLRPRRRPSADRTRARRGPATDGDYAHFTRRRPIMNGVTFGSAHRSCLR